MVSYRNTLRANWDLITLLMSIYNAFVVPVHFSFKLPRSFEQIDSIIENIIDLLFFFDNVLMFFTTRPTRRGIEIRSHYRIMIEYTRTWRFKFDTLSLLGNNVFHTVHPGHKYF